MPHQRNNECTPDKSGQIRLFSFLMLIGWTGLVAVSCWSQVSANHREIERLALFEARTAFAKDILYRRWASRHGGVYVPVTDDTPPNPNLFHISERDIVTPSGKRLTLMNPAYMMRQVFEDARGSDGPQGHITSLNPLWPANAPDAWERESLRSFERGNRETSIVTTTNGKPSLRLMRPLITEASCLKCHAKQGYRVGDVRGGISVSVPMSELMAAGRQEQRTMILWHGIVWLLGGGVVAAGGRRIRRDTRALVQQGDRLLERNEELAVTEEELRQQVDEYLATQSRLEEANRKLEAIMNCLGDCMYIVSTDYRVLYQNRIMTETFGEHTGCCCYQSLCCRDDVCASCTATEVFTDRATHRKEIVTEKDGRLLCLEITASPLFDGFGSLIGAVQIMRDVTEHRKSVEEVDRLNRELEQRVVERTAQLAESNRRLEEEIRERSTARDAVTRLNDELLERTRTLETVNRELEAFSYSVSHDLRAPLRHIKGYIEMLTEECSGLLDGPCAGYLERIRAASTRMGNLIDCLLELSRVSRFEMRRHQVDLSGQAVQTARMLRREDPGRDVEFVIADGLVADGDPHLLQLVMENLLGNAWKYTSKKTAARIEFGWMCVDGKDAYFVRDNGAGFDMAYGNKLFGAFQRLHGSEFEGTGIGLATVQRIIHRHGGTVWGEGRVGEGAVFWFTLP